MVSLLSDPVRRGEAVAGGSETYRFARPRIPVYIVLLASAK